MAIDPKKKRIKIKVKSGSSALEIPEGYERDEKRSKPGKDVFVKKSTTTTTVTPPGSAPKVPEIDFKPNMLGGRLNMVAEKTGPKMKFMADKFPGGAKGEAQYREDEKPMGSTSTSKTKLIIKNRGSFAEKVFGPRDNWIFSGKGKEQRQIDRQNKKNCKVGQGCYVGK